MKTKFFILLLVILFAKSKQNFAQTHGQDATFPANIWQSTRFYEAIEAGASNKIYIGGRSATAPILWHSYPDNTSTAPGKYRYRYSGVHTASISYANWGQVMNFDFSQDQSPVIGDEVNWKNRLSLFNNGQMHLTGGFKILDENTNDVQFKVDNSGHLWAREVRVLLGTIPPDYVFSKGYKLISLYHLEQFIKKHKHLPNIPSAKEYNEQGSIDIGELQFKLLEKVEELTLYIIELNKKNEQLERDLMSIKSKLK
jgi:hypothetical protein